MCIQENILSLPLSLSACISELQDFKLTDIPISTKDV